MNCKQNRSFRAALALGYLWGMGQATYPTNNLEDRAAKTKIILDLIGVHLVVNAIPENVIQVHNCTIYPVEQGEWAIEAPNQEVQTTQTYWSALRKALNMEMDARFSHIPAPSTTDPTALADHFTAYLTPFCIHPPQVSFTAQYDGQYAARFQIGDQWELYSHSDPRVAIQEAMKTYLNRQVSWLYSHMESLFGMNPTPMTHLLDNGYFRATYLDEHTAETIDPSGETRSGWYLMRDSQFYSGPFAAPNAAMNWVWQEWGKQNEKYAKLVALNDQIQQIRSRYEREVRRVKESGFGAKKVKTLEKQLKEQSEYNYRLLAEPFIMGEQDETEGKYPKKCFTVRNPNNPQGAYLIRIWHTPHNIEAQWTVMEIGENGVVKSVDSGGSSVSPAEIYTGDYETLLYAIRRLLIKDEISVLPYPIQNIGKNGA